MQGLSEEDRWLAKQLFDRGWGYKMIAKALEQPEHRLRWFKRRHIGGGEPPKSQQAIYRGGKRRTLEECESEMFELLEGQWNARR